ncbi:MAG: metallophosphoesterase [Fretibacterium sp.]|nr:metallophosphoesterase [Fretibacterium sp.]
MAFSFVASLVSVAIVFYETASIIFPLKISVYWKIACTVLLLLGAFKNILFQIIGGGMFFAPNLPHGVILAGALLYNLLIVALLLSVVKDAVWLFWKACHLLGVCRGDFPAGKASGAVLALAVILTLYGTWEAIRVPDVAIHDLSLPGLSEEFEGKKMALLVDLHASSLNRRPLIQAIVEKTNALSPDIVLLPGDFVDGLARDRKDDLEPLSRLRAPLGIWGTSGNHEYYSGYADWTKLLSEWGVALLENRHVVLSSGSGKLVIAGLPDQQGARFGFAAPDVKEALRGAPADVPVILMAHRPEDAAENAEAGVTLQLSGHTHGGMMPVLDKIVARFNGGYLRGWYDVGTMKLYVSPGTSLWNGFPLRLLNPAEITLMILHRAR